MNLNFRTWAAYGGFLPLTSAVFRENCRTRALESAADHLRSGAVTMASDFGRQSALEGLRLGASQAFQIQAALDLYIT